jgi:hypothetical protein
MCICDIAMNGELDLALVSGNELIGDVVQVITDDLRLRADRQNVIASPLDERCFPASGDGAERVPCMTRDKAELPGPDSEFSFNMGVHLKVPAYDA